MRIGLLTCSLSIATLCTLGCQPEDRAAPDAPIAQAPIEEVASEAPASQEREDAIAPGSKRPVEFHRQVATPSTTPGEAPTWRWTINHHGDGISQDRATNTIDAFSVNTSRIKSTMRVNTSCKADIAADDSKSRIVCELSSVDAARDFKSRRLHILKGGFVDRIAMVMDGKMLYSVHHSAIASGARVFALDLEAKSLETWRRDLTGLGPVSHSKYRNETQLRIEETPTGRVLRVYGKESSGKYIETLDLKTGALISNFKIAEDFTPHVASAPLMKAADTTVFSASGSCTGADANYTLTREGEGHQYTLTMLAADDTTWNTRVRVDADELMMFEHEGQLNVLGLNASGGLHITYDCERGDKLTEGLIKLDATRGEGATWTHGRFGAFTQLENRSADGKSREIFHLGKDGKILSHQRVLSANE